MNRQQRKDEIREEIEHLTEQMGSIASRIGEHMWFRIDHIWRSHSRTRKLLKKILKLHKEVEESNKEILNNIHVGPGHEKDIAAAHEKVKNGGNIIIEPKK